MVDYIESFTLVLIVVLNSAVLARMAYTLLASRDEDSFPKKKIKNQVKVLAIMNSIGILAKIITSYFT